MRQISTVLVSIGVALAALVAANAAVSAQPRHHHHHYYRHLTHRAVLSHEAQVPLTVNRRSWLDPGPLAPVGSTGPAYMADSTYFQQTPDEQYFPSRFHEDNLPRPLYVPGSTTPLVTFSTPRDPF